MSQAVRAGACDSVLAAVHIHPPIERKGPRPIMTVEDRGYILASLRHVSDVIPYETERDLHDLILATRPNVLILNSDRIGRPYVGDDLPIPVFYAEWRNDWSILEFVQNMMADSRF